MEEIYSDFLKKERENVDFLIKDFSFYFVMLELFFFEGGGIAVIACFTNYILI